MDSEAQRMHPAIIAPFPSLFPAKALLGNSKSVTDFNKRNSALRFLLLKCSYWLREDFPPHFLSAESYPQTVRTERL